MKGSNGVKKPFKVSRVNELANYEVAERSKLENSNNTCDHSTTTVEIIDLEEMKERLFKLQMEQQHAINNRNFFQNEIGLMEEEIIRMIEKIKEVEEAK